MTSVFDVLNLAVTGLFDVLCWPLAALPPIWALVLLALLTGGVTMWVFGLVADQAAIAEIHDRVRGNLIGVRIYRHEVGVTLRLQARILRDTATYTRHAVRPMLVLLVPVVLIMTQVALRFVSRPLLVNESVIVKAYVRDPALLGGPVVLDPSRGLHVETPAVRIASQREVAWRVRVIEPGQHTLRVRLGDATVEMPVVTGGRWGAVPRRRTGRGVEALLYPGVPAIPAGVPIEAIDIGYPTLKMAVFRWPVQWLAGFFVFSLAFGYLLKGMVAPVRR